jgi:hypothetical protein
MHFLIVSITDLVMVFSLIAGMALHELQATDQQQICAETASCTEKPNKMKNIKLDT